MGHIKEQVLVRLNQAIKMERLYDADVQAEKIDEKHRKATLPKVGKPPYGWQFDGWYTAIESPSMLVPDDSKRVGGSGETVIVNVDDLYANSPCLKDLLTNGYDSIDDGQKYTLCVKARYSKISKRDDPCAGYCASLEGRFAQGIPVDKKHKDKINDAIAYSEEGAKERTLNYDDVKDLCDKFEAVYKEKIKKRRFDGCYFAYLEGANCLAANYQGEPCGTVIFVAHLKGRWYLYAADRVPCNTTHYRYVCLSETAKAEIVRRAESLFWKN